MVNGKSDGNLIGDYLTMSLTALLPALLADSHERCFVIGFGTGVTTGELAALEETRTVDVAEISRGVIEAAPIFDYGNLGASKNPKVSIHRGDAYRTLLKTAGTLRRDRLGAEQPVGGGRGDAVQPRVPRGGAEPALPGRRLRAVGASLRDRPADRRARAAHVRVGVPPCVGLVHAARPTCCCSASPIPERALDVAALEASFRRPDFAAAFARAEIESFPALLAHEVLPLGTLSAAVAGRRDPYAAPPDPE